MSFTFPQFHDPIPIDATRAWIADFHSYDQRNDDCYYLVTVRERDRDLDPQWKGPTCAPFSRTGALRLVSVATQFISQCSPPSSENDCSKR
jgi:hypothetical protein